MKKSLFTVLLLLPLFVLAQEQKTLKNDLSLSFVTVQSAHQAFPAVVFQPRMLYRRYQGNFAWRVQLEGMQYETPILSQYQQQDQIRQQSLSATLGAQYGYKCERWGIYAFGEAGFGKLDLTEYSARNGWTFQQESIRGLQTRAGIGLQFQAGEHVVLGAEGGLSWLYGRTTDFGGGVNMQDRISAIPVPYWSGQAIGQPLQALWLGWRF